MREFYEKVNKLGKQVNEIRKDQLKLSQQMNQTDVSSKIYNTHLQKYSKVTKERNELIEQQINGIDKIEEINELNKRLEYYSTCLDLCTKIKSGEFEKCRSIIREVTIATDDITL